MKFCPRCGAGVEQDDSHCSKCGKDLDAVRKQIYDEPIPDREEGMTGEARVKAKKSGPPASPLKQAITCPFCGVVVPSDIERCSFCGTSIPKDASPVEYSCGVCGSPMKFINRYQKWYCYQCEQYA